jgi:hypothetical protein
MVIALALFGSESAFAHKASDSYLTLKTVGTELRGEWHLALRDLNTVLELDANDDGAITWGELHSQKAAVWAYAQARLQFGNSEAASPLPITDLLVDNHSDGAYAVLRFALEPAPSATELQIRYRAFFDVDGLHRGLLRLETPAGVQTAVFAPDSAVQRFSLHSSRPPFATLAFVREGIWHIWTGYDHILFLLALLLPGVLRLSREGWEPETSFGPVLREVLRVVTAFTLAHSITLSLAAIGWLRLLPRLVECAIAASVVVAAANNLWPVFHRRAWAVAFMFGLVHGFGFANALSDLGLEHVNLAQTLLSFNLGVEAGQIAIVGAFLPLAFVLRQQSFYRRYLLPIGSSTIAATASVWFAQRLLSF